MENAIGIIYTDGCSRFLDGSSNAMAEVLFRPVAEWVNCALDDAGVKERLYIFHDGEEDLYGYADGYDYMLTDRKIPYAVAADYVNSHRDCDFFVASLESIFTKKEYITGSLSQHRAEGKDITMIASGSRSAFMAEMGVSPFWAKGTFLSELFANMDDDVSDTGKFIAYAFKTLSDEGQSAGTFISGNPDLNMRARSVANVVTLNATSRAAVMKGLVKVGVKFIATDGIIITPDCKIGKGTLVMPGTSILNGSVIGENCVIGPNSYISDATVGDGAEIRSSEAVGVTVPAGEKVGPFVKIQ